MKRSLLSILVAAQLLALLLVAAPAGAQATGGTSAEISCPASGSSANVIVANTRNFAWVIVNTRADRVHRQGAHVEPDQGHQHCAPRGLVDFGRSAGDVRRGRELYVHHRVRQVDLVHADVPMSGKTIITWIAIGIVAQIVGMALYRRFFP